MSIADKLTLLINTKQDIKSAISEKGVEVTGGMTTYADAIRRIETGGGGGDSFYVPIGLKFTYKSTFTSYNAPNFTLPKLILADGYTDGSYMFDGNESLTSINGIYTSTPSLTTCYSMFNKCESLESIPYFDISNVTDMYRMFTFCRSLTTIPLLNTSNVLNMDQSFYGCESLTSIPQMDTSRVKSMAGAFSMCSSLTTIPLLSTSNVVDMRLLFSNCKLLTNVPQLDTSNVNDMDHMFAGCSSLTTIPLLNTSNVIDTSYMFFNCESLTNIPQLDLSKVNDVSWMFYGCKSLTAIPQLNTSNVTNFYNCFNSCKSLTTIPQLNTSNVTNFENCFKVCHSLQSLPLLDFSNVTLANYMFDDASSSNIAPPYPELNDLGGFKNLKVNLNLSGMPNLIVQSLMNVINNLYDFVGNGSTTTRTLTLGTTNLNKLTAEQKAVATNKGWILK